VSYLVSPHDPGPWWWLDALGLLACLAAWMWMNRVDRRGRAE